MTLTLTAAAPEKLAADVAHRPGNAAVPGRPGVVGVTAALDVVGVKVVGVAHPGRGRRAPEEAHDLAHRLEIEKGEGGQFRGLTGESFFRFSDRVIANVAAVNLWSAKNDMEVEIETCFR